MLVTAVCKQLLVALKTTGHAEELVADRPGRGKRGSVLEAALPLAPEVVEDGTATVEVFPADPKWAGLAERREADVVGYQHRIACRFVATTAHRGTDTVLNHVEAVAL